MSLYFSVDEVFIVSSITNEAEPQCPISNIEWFKGALFYLFHYAICEYVSIFFFENSNHD